jgi:hypothetical protein
MAEGRQSTKHSLVSKASKRAFAPLAQAVVTAGSAYLTRKAMKLWQEKLQPRLEERGGGRTVAKEALETVAEKAGPASGPVESLAEKVGGEDEGSGGKASSSRDAERRKREQRRNQRRKAVEKSGSS